jgi:hypothetical protein
MSSDKKEANESIKAQTTKGRGTTTRQGLPDSQAISYGIDGTIASNGTIANIGEGQAQTIVQRALTQWQQSTGQLFNVQLEEFQNQIDEIRLRQAETTARESEQRSLQQAREEEQRSQQQAREEERRNQQYTREEERRSQQYAREEESRNKLRAEFDRYFENQVIRQGKSRLFRQLTDVQSQLVEQLNAIQNANQTALTNQQFGYPQQGLSPQGTVTDYIADLATPVRG